MPSISNFLLLFTLFSALFIVPSTSQCSSFAFPNHVTYASCTDLPVLNSSLHWNYHSRGTVDIAFKKSNAKDSTWVAWGINPTTKSMVGSQALVAYRGSDGTYKAHAVPITSYAPRMQEGNLSFPVDSISASYTNGNIIIFASFQLPTNMTLVNHVWQEGSVSDDGTLNAHPMAGPNLQSFGTVDFVSGKVLETNKKMNSRAMLRNVHGILNVISWGILMPIGVILVRYLKTFDNLGEMWFHLHRSCQSLAFFIGIIGFSTGLYMGNHYGVHHTPHKCIGITITCLACAQVLVAVFLRPKKDHKNRKFWNIFHFVIGYATIGLAILNVLKGFDILGGNRNWKNAYIAIIIGLGGIATLLEVITWILICNQKKAQKFKDQVNRSQQLP